MRIAARPSHMVGPHQQVPSVWMALIHRVVISSDEARAIT
jgi:hypothetical protein